MTRTRHETRPAGEQIRAAREALGLTQPELARRAGISRPPTICEVEHGANTTLDLLQRLATALACPLVIAPGLPAPTVDRPGRSSKPAGKRKST